MKHCLFCGNRITVHLSFTIIFSYQKIISPIICQSCRENFRPIDYQQACPGCSRTQSDQKLCADCLRWQKKEPGVQLNHRALFTYNDMAKDFMDRFKFQGDILLANLFSEELADLLGGYQETHHIVPIPISEKSMEERGFNQMDLLLSKAGIQYEEWLSHIGKGERQARKSRVERLQAKQFIKMNVEKKDEQQINKDILLVDDVYTTGRTILHAKNVFNQFDQRVNALNKKQEQAQTLSIQSFSIFR